MRGALARKSDDGINSARNDEAFRIGDLELEDHRGREAGNGGGVGETAQAVRVAGSRESTRRRTDC